MYVKEDSDYAKLAAHFRVQTVEVISVLRSKYTIILTEYFSHTNEWEWLDSNFSLRILT